MILSPPPPTRKGKTLQPPQGGCHNSQGGDNSNPRKGVSQLPRVVGFDFKPTTHHPKWENITNLTRVFNSQGWWALILSPPPTTPEGKTSQPSQGGVSTPKGGQFQTPQGSVQFPRVAGFDFKSTTHYPHYVRCILPVTDGVRQSTISTTDSRKETMSTTPNGETLFTILKGDTIHVYNPQGGDHV